jgi:hypothetical protein
MTSFFIFQSAVVQGWFWQRQSTISARISSEHYKPWLCWFMTLFLFAFSIVTQAENAFVTGAEPAPGASIRDPEPWRENRVRLPAWPVADQLIPLALQTASPFQYFIDSQSLQTDTDDVIRYTLIAESTTGGARNIAYEGIRCTPHGAYRIYAYGYDEQFHRAEQTDWQSLANAATRYPAQYALWRHYLCVPRLFQPRSRQQQLRFLRQGRVPEYNHSGFLTE